MQSPPSGEAPKDTLRALPGGAKGKNKMNFPVSFSRPPIAGSFQNGRRYCLRRPARAEAAEKKRGGLRYGKNEIHIIEPCGNRALL